MQTENQSFMKEIETVYFDIVKQHSIIVNRENDLKNIFLEAGVDRL